MLLKTVTQRYDFEDETRWSREARDLMICSLAMDPRFKRFAVQLCPLSRSEEYVWFVVKEMAMRHLKFEKQSDSLELQSPEKRQKTSMFAELEEFIEEGPIVGSSSVHCSSSSLDTALEAYKRMPALSQDSDPLLFWRDYDTPTSPVLPLLPLAASILAVPATEAICERLFKAGGQVLTSARLRLLGSRVESVLMTHYNSRLTSSTAAKKRVAEASGSSAAAGC